LNTTLQSTSFWNDEAIASEGYDERLTTDGEPRPHWQTLSVQFEELGRETLTGWASSIAQFIRENGITAQSEEDVRGSERPWQLSALPFVLSANEWGSLKEGLIERTRLLEAVLGDLLGDQHLIRQRIIPGELMWANPHFHRCYSNLDPAPQKLHVIAADLVRGGDGQWRVTGDRTRAPSGLGYLLENRIVTGRVMPGLIRSSNTQRLAGFFETLKQHLQSLAPADRGNPRVALLTPPSGSYREFEDNYLARYLGLSLIQGSDLAVRGGKVNLKTLGGLQPIQVLWRHISDRRCDPLELDPGSREGVTGLLGCIRSKNVAVINSVGSVLAQSPGLLPYLDAAHQHFFGGSLRLPTVKTYWCGDPEHLRYVLEHLDSFIFREALAVSGHPPLVLDRLSQEEQSAFRNRLKAEPQKFIAQERLESSHTPVWTEAGVRSQKVALRSFQLNTPDGVEVLPGGLARVGDDQIELSQSPVSGQMTLDCWVTSDQPVDHHKSLLPNGEQPLKLRRGGDELPSRVAEHLYWLGRYVERAEAIARLMRTTLSRISGEDNWESLPEVKRLVYALASLGQIEPSFAVDSFAANLPRIEQNLPASVLDPSQPRGLIRTMKSVMHNATVIRDRLSLDAYRILKRASRELTQPSLPTRRSTTEGSPSNKIGFGDAIERVGTLVVDLLAFAGVTSEGFVRTHAWQFLELGRRIERADHTCDFLITTLCPATDQGRAVCEAVLETTDSIMTYRSRYMNLMQLAPVIDLLVTDETNPRSIRFQLDCIASLMDDLPSVEGPVGLDAVQRIVLDLRYRVTSADPIELSQKAEDGSLEKLRKLLSNVTDDLPKLSECVNARYLIHTEVTQMLTGTGR
jgi:uncharacterized circularly permuted ATP-grasp superfamily protein/uncharacterized alpha-E superfamily protein